MIRFESRRDDRKAETAKSRPGKADPKTPPAGPHAKEELTDREKTPGTGALPEKDQQLSIDVGPD